MPSQPPKSWPLIDVFRPATADVLHAMRLDTTQRLNYLTSRLRAALSVCMDRPLKDRNALYDMMTFELVIPLFTASENC